MPALTGGKVQTAQTQKGLSYFDADAVLQLKKKRKLK